MKRIKLSLTIPQALALREMALSSDQFNSDEACDFTPAARRVLSLLEDAIESARGEFANRMTERPQQPKGSINR